VSIRDGVSGGWNTSSGTVSTEDPRTIILERPAPLAFLVSRRAQASDLVPVIAAVHTEHVIIRDLAVESAWRPGPSGIPVMLDFVSPAIALHVVQGAVVSGVTVRGFPGDGVGVQRGERVLVRATIAAENGLNGFHPGTDARLVAFDSVTAVRNALDGIFFCAGVTRSTITRSLLVQNGAGGVGHLGSGGDRGNVVAANTIAYNRRYGLQLGETGNSVIGNRVFENGWRGARNFRVEWSSWGARLAHNRTTPPPITTGAWGPTSRP
jgi:hypothetical protein